MKLFFSFGSQPALSFAELKAFLNRDGFGYEIKEVSLTGLEADVEIDREDVPRLQEGLGGTVRVAEVISGGIEEDGLVRVIVDSIIAGKNGKAVFGVSLYGRDMRRSDLKTLSVAIKKEVRSVRTGKVRFVLPKKGFKLSAATVLKNQLLSGGYEFLVIRREDRFMIARTITIQDFISYSRRDYDRPNRSMEVGMLPPKIARIMINLAGEKTLKSLYDPFCGLGTIPAEALLMGYPVMCSDISAENIRMTRENLQWLVKEFGVASNLYRSENVFEADATRLGSEKRVSSEKIGFIVSEPFLGPILNRPLSDDGARSRFEQLKGLYFGFFKEAREVLGIGKTIVVVVPFFRKNNGNAFSPWLDEIKDIGYTHVVPGFGSCRDLFEKGLSPNGNLIYKRPKQFVGREIIKFRTN